MSETRTPEWLNNGCEPGKRTWLSFPQPGSNITVPTPKDIITAALPNITDLQDKIDATWMDQMFGQGDGSELDTVQVLGLSVAMIQQAIDSMAQVKYIGETANEQSSS